MSSRNKRKKIRFECYVCGEQTEHSQMCCGHPMIELLTARDVLNFQLVAELERV